MNTIANSTPKGLNHEGFGGVKNLIPNPADKRIEIRFASKKYKRLIVLDNAPVSTVSNSSKIINR
ncbi:hypothetical protein [Metabacillus sp. SLBN-84]